MENLHYFNLSKNLTHGIVNDNLCKKLFRDIDNFKCVVTNCFEIVPYIRKHYGDVKIIGTPMTEFEALGFEKYGINPEFVIFNNELKCSKSIGEYLEYINKIISEKMPALKDIIVVFNPPYQGNNRQQIYPIFYKWAINCGASQVCMIFPSAWRKPTSGSGLSQMNTKKIKKDKQIVWIDDVDNAFKNIEGAKEVNIVLWKKGYDNELNGSQLIYTNGESPKVVDLYLNIEDTQKINEIVKLYEIVKSKPGFKGMDKLVSSRKPYGIDTNFFENQKGLPNIYCHRKADDDLLVYSKENGEPVVRYIDKDYPLPIGKEGIKLNDCRYKYKVYVGKSWGGGDTFIGGAYSNIVIGYPGEICTDKYLEVGNYKDVYQAKCLAKYCMSKFLRALLTINKQTHANSRDKWEFIPVQDFKEDWWETNDIDKIDEHLFDKYDVPKEIRDFVINNIQPRTIDNIRNYTGRLEGKSKIKEVESAQENVDESVVEVEKQLSLW